MNDFVRKVEAKHWHVVAFGVLLFSLSSLAAAYTIDDQTLRTILSGVATGGLVTFVQIIFQWHTYKQLTELRSLRIKKVIPHRDDKNLYKARIDGAQNEIYLLAHTCERFLEDFANPDEERSDKRALIKALERDVKIHVLLPDPKGIKDEHERTRIESSVSRLESLQKKYCKSVEFKLFEGPSIHSVFVVDNECFVGPMFPGVKRSRNLPAIITEWDSAIGRPYVDYFKAIWNK